jgi:pyruvate-formate lyase-activating enzyme
MAGDILTIETGIRCNNLCNHCPQGVIRRSGRILAEPSTQDLEIRLQQGREAGYESVAFSGGEPTIRRDLPDLASASRRFGYSHVSITTNGRMLSYPGLVRKLIDSGVDGFTVSLHGPDAAVHDTLTGTPGSFGQAVEGLEALERASRETGGSIGLSTITVLVPETLPHLRDTLELAGRLGVMLHLVQPFILSRETVPCADRFLMSLDALEEGVRAACKGGLAHEGRLKLYNLPPCRFHDMDVPVENQRARLKTFREHHVALSGPGFQPSGQHFRSDTCRECEESCPGFRLEHLPEAALVAGIMEDINAFTRDRPGTDLLLTGSDLLSAPALERILKGIGQAQPPHLRVVWGAMARIGIEDFIDACKSGAVSEIPMVLRPPLIRQPDGNVVLPGNLDAIESDLAAFDPARGPRPALLMVLPMLYSGFHLMDAKRLDVIIRQMRAVGGRRIWVAAPEILDDDSPLRGSDLRQQVVAALPNLVHDWDALGCEVRLARLPRPTRAGHAGLLEDEVARFLPTEELIDGLIRHRCAGPHMGWVMSSNLEWAYPP